MVLIFVISSLLIGSVETVMLAWLGRGGWLSAVKSALAGLIPFWLVILGSAIFVQTPWYERYVSWSMVVMLPILGLYLLFWVAFFVKVIVQCWISGAMGGLICGFIIFPMLCLALVGPRPSVLTLLDVYRPPFNMEEAVERNDLRYIKANITHKNRPHVWRLALEELNVGAATIALNGGIQPNDPLVIRSPTLRTPLVLVLDRGETGQRPGWSTNNIKQRLAMVQLLIDRGADPNKLSPKVVFYSSSPDAGKFEAPLEAAAWDNDLVDCLLRNGALMRTLPAPPSPTSSPPPTSPATPSTNPTP